MSYDNYKPMKGKLSGSFGFKTDSNGEVINRKRVTCFICEKGFTYCGSVTSLQYHLRKMHNIENRSSSATRLTAQENGEQGAAPPGISSTKEAELISKVAMWMVSSLRPPSIVEDAGLSDLLRMALNCPTYSLPSRYIISNYISRMYEVEKFCIKEKIYRAKFVSLTGDKWTSITDEPYIAVTGHWIDDEWQLRSSILQVELGSGEHQSGGYVNQFKRVAQDWGIEGKIAAICMDNDYNINDVVDDLNYPYLRCIAHTLKLAFTRALRTVPGDIITKCMKILGHFEEKLEFRLECRMNYPSIVSRDIGSQWTSTYTVLDSLMNMKETVYTMSRENPSSIDTLTEAEWEIVENLAECLKPCSDVTELLGGSSYVTASIVIPAVQHLKNLMSVSLLEPAYISTFKKTFVDHLCMQMAVWDRFDMYEEATALDPRFKYLKCLPEANRESVWMRFKDNTVNLDDIKVEDPPKKKFKLLLEEPSRSDGHGEKEPTKYVTNSMDLELSIYRSLKELDNDFSNPLEWWKRHSLQLPGLATLAQEKLCIPATSVPIKQLFSAASFTDNVQRAILDSSDINVMVCLRSWLQ